MNAPRLIAATVVTLALAVGAAFAAFERAAPSPRSMRPAECADQPIPRVVVTARRDLARVQTDRVARVVVTARRLAAATAGSQTL